MIMLKPNVMLRSSDGVGSVRRSRRIVTYPPPSTGTNCNPVEKVEHDPNQNVVWKIMRAPDGDFVYDHELKARKRTRRKRCPGCENFLETSQRKCLLCQAE